MKSCCFTEPACGKGQVVPIRKDERIFIHLAAKFLDRPSFLLRMANSIGRPLEIALGTLPTKHQRIIHQASESALTKGLKVVTRTVARHRVIDTFVKAEISSRRVGRWHSVASFGVGAVGGLIGILSLPLELPVTTAIMLRSIASIANEFGMDLSDPQVQMECLYILSLGAPETIVDDSMSSAYWTSRAAFSTAIHDAAAFLAGKSAREVMRSVENRSARVLIKFITAVAARFEIVVSEKMLAEAVPVIGAIGGGAINAAFTDYFSDAARYHFGLRALENRHGREAVEKYYNKREVS